MSDAERVLAKTTLKNACVVYWRLLWSSGSRAPLFLSPEPRKSNVCAGSSSGLTGDAAHHTSTDQHAYRKKHTVSVFQTTQQPQALFGDATVVDYLLVYIERKLKFK